MMGTLVVKRLMHGAKMTEWGQIGLQIICQFTADVLFCIFADYCNDGLLCYCLYETKENLDQVFNPKD